MPLGCSAALQSVCQALTCRPIESSKRGIAALSYCDVPKRHSSRSRPTSPTASPWAAQWACGSSQLEFDQHLTTASPQVTRAVVVGCASPRRHSSRSRPTSPTASPWAAQWACGSSQKESTNIPNCYPQITRAVALIVLNAGTAGLKHLPDFSTGTADLVKLKLLHWERVKKMSKSHTWSSLRTPSLPTCHSCTNLSPRPVLPAQDRVSRQPGKHTHYGRQLTAG